MHPEEAHKPSSAGLFVAVVFVFLLFLTAALVFASFPVGAYAFFSGNLSGNFSASSLGNPYLWVGPLPVVLPFQTSYGTAFLFVSFVYVAMFVAAATQGRRLTSAVSSVMKEGLRGLFSNTLIVVLVSIGFLVFTATVLDSLVIAAGGTIGNQIFAGDPLRILVGLTLTPLREEFGFRMLVIGLFAVALSVGRPARSALLAFWRPSAAYQGLAVGGAAFAIIWAVTGASAVAFGVCHVSTICGGGWDLAKLPEATYGGIVLGYLYVKYGFHVAVLAHWGVDYFGLIYAFFGQAVSGIPWNSATNEYVLQQVVDVDLLFLFGVASFLVVIYVGVKGLVAKRAGAPAGNIGSS